MYCDDCASFCFASPPSRFRSGAREELRERISNFPNFNGSMSLCC